MRAVAGGSTRRVRSARRPRRADALRRWRTGPYSQACAQVCRLPQARASRSRRRRSGARGAPVLWLSSCRASPPAEDLTKRWSRQHEPRRAQPHRGQLPVSRARSASQQNRSASSSSPMPSATARSWRLSSSTTSSPNSVSMMNSPLDRRSAPAGRRPDGLSCGPRGPIVWTPLARRCFEKERGHCCPLSPSRLRRAGLSWPGSPRADAGLAYPGFSDVSWQLSKLH